MSLVSPSTQSVQAFVFGLDSETEPHRTVPTDLVDDLVHIEGDEKRQSMYVELLDGTQPNLPHTETRGCIDGLI
jgi:hypothetical protein